MFNSQIPFLVNRTKPAYKKILLAVGKEQSVSVLSIVAMDVVRQFDAELTVLTVYPPNIDKKRYNELEGLPGEVEVIARSHGLTVNKQFRDGNPIKQIRAAAKDYDLLIIGFAQQDRSTFGNPDISLHLFHKAPCSILMVPWQTAGR
jgi:nucleotide-binding universal stress UspA family protein